MRHTLQVDGSVPMTAKRYPAPDPSWTGKLQFRMRLHVLPALLLAFATTFAYARNYTNIVVFGDSLSDTGNVAHLTEDKYGARVPGPIANYTDGRFTDGFDTLPAAQNYFGVWIEQFAASLPSHPEIRNGNSFSFAANGVYHGCRCFSQRVP